MKARQSNLQRRQRGVTESTLTVVQRCETFLRIQSSWLKSEKKGIVVKIDTIDGEQGDCFYVHNFWMTLKREASGNLMNRLNEFMNDFKFKISLTLKRTLKTLKFFVRLYMHLSLINYVG